MKISRILLPVSLTVGTIVSFSLVYAAITFDDDNSEKWYGPSDINGFTDPTATVTYDGNFDAGECPKASGGSNSEVIIPGPTGPDETNSNTTSSPPSRVSGHVSI